MTLRSALRSVGWLLVATSALSFAMSLIDYFTPENGIDGTSGVVLVVISTFLMLAASAAISSDFAHGWARTILTFLILLDVLGTGLAAYMLEASVLLSLMVTVLIAWLFGAFAGGQSRPPPSAEAMS